MKNNANDNAAEIVPALVTKGISGEAPTENYQPFVNEECGDTMWDEVLEQAEKRDRLQNILAGKKGTD